MNRKLSTPLLVTLLLIVSVLLFLIQRLLFARPNETAFYFFQDLAFVPINVLLVTLGLNTILNRRERLSKLEKVGIVINEFFAEAGTELILAFCPFIENLDDISPHLRPDGLWKDKDFDDVTIFLNKRPLTIDVRRNELTEMQLVLQQKKEQILRLFENANLLENDRFTDMLWAVYHVHDELRSRPSLTDLPSSDIMHLNNDILRAVQLLFVEWVEYMRLLKKRYPYLYSLASRKCPFSNNDVIIR